MAKFLFVVPPFFGHIFPTLAIGQELVSKGHYVCWVGLKEIDDHFLPDGSVFIVPSELEQYKDKIDDIIKKQNESTSIPVEDMYKWAFNLTWFPFCDMIMNGLKRIAEEFQPDLIVTDQCMLAGPICANLLGIPFVSSISIQPGMYYPAHSPYVNEEWLFDSLLEKQKQYGIDSMTLLFDSPLLNLVYMSKEFVNGHRFPDHYRFLGPMVEKRPQPVSFNWAEIKNNEWPMVYVSLGTVLQDIAKSFYKKVIDAFYDHEFNVIAAVDPELYDEWPDNFYIQKYLPQTEILPKVDVLITPGGFNTVNEALYFGIPMVVLPMGHDQFGNSEMILARGCGIKMKYKRTNGERLRDSVNTILHDNRYRLAAEKIAETSKLGGAPKAAIYLEDLTFNIKEKRVSY